MQITDHGRLSTIHLERYEDLLTVRTLPDYRFTGYKDVEVDTDDLALIGLARKTTSTLPFPISDRLFDYQAWIVERAVSRERFAIFAGTGLGKTLMQLEWARQVTAKHGGRTLIVAPLNVCKQTIREADKFYGAELPVEDCTTRKELAAWLETGTGVGITNYEKFDNAAYDPDSGSTKYQQGDVLPVGAVILDESSMLKSFGPRKFAIIRSFDGVRYKLACSATPAPNQRTEFAQHALFLGQVRSTTEYLTAYFMNRDGDWTFKPHSFDAWIANLASWGVFVRDPKSWGFEDHLHDLPPLTEVFPVVGLTAEQNDAARRFETGDQASLFGATPGGITSRTKMMQIAHGFELDSGKIVARYETLKPQWIVDLIVNDHPTDPVLIWVTFDEEGDQLERMLGDAGVDAMHLSGRTNRKVRDQTIEDYADGQGPRVLIVKPAMFAFGLNLQACSVQVFSTITDSFERYYQCVRRSHRFGQTKPVKVYVPLTQLDDAICQNTMNKQSTFIEDAIALEAAVVARLRPRDTSEAPVTDATPQVELDRTEGATWTLVHGDSIAHLPTMAPASVDLCVFSPPFAALYAYSKALGDMGNVRADTEFALQWQWFAEALLPAMKPGRVVAIHCKEIIRFANTHGYRHASDFPSELREGMVAAGFRYQRRITIWKNPQLEATRNKETSLLHVTALRDAVNSFPQTGEYLMVFTAPGDNEVAVTHTRDDHTFELHTEWMNSIWDASHPTDEDARQFEEWIDPDGTGPAWHGIRETDVLTARTAKDHPEEKHVCPLQLGLIDRCVRLWSNPGELVFSPFAGIGSEGWSAIGNGRSFYGVELKESYYRTACNNLADRERMIRDRLSLFDVPA